MNYLRISLSLFSILVLIACTQTQRDVKTRYPLQYQADFEGPQPMSDFIFSDPGKWVLSEDGNPGSCIEFLGKGGYVPGVRSPHIIGLISNMKFGSFVLEADFLQTGKEYGHRDMCLFFGLQERDRFYYVHLATRADPHAHNIFIVNQEPRTAIADTTTDGIDWGREEWHRIRLERNVDDGMIRVYFDDMETPVMQGSDQTFTSGFVGFGSFDDSGRIDNIRIWSADAVDETTTMFSAKQD